MEVSVLANSGLPVFKACSYAALRLFRSDRRSDAFVEQRASRTGGGTEIFHRSHFDWSTWINTPQSATAEAKSIFSPKRCRISLSHALGFVP
jgi:hypothetical protein